MEDELLLELLEDDDADDQGDHSEYHAEQGFVETWSGPVQHDLSEITDIVIHRVPLHDLHRPAWEDLDWIEERSEVRPCGDEDAPEMLYVSEIHYECRQYEAESQAECEDEDQQEGKQQHVHRWCDAEEEHDCGYSNERDGEVDQRERDLLQREDDLPYPDLLDQGSRSDDGGHGGGGCIGHEVEERLSQDQIDREVLYLKAEEIGEDGR